MEPISAITFDLNTSEAVPTTPATAGGQVSVFDIAQFEELHGAGVSPTIQPTSQAANASSESSGFQAALNVLKTLNGRVDVLGTEALRFSSERKELSPSEMLTMTMHAHQFLFQSELTANVANRTSEGVQQLFRQQS